MKRGRAGMRDQQARQKLVSSRDLAPQRRCSAGDDHMGGEMSAVLVMYEI